MALTSSSTGSTVSIAGGSTTYSGGTGGSLTLAGGTAPLGTTGTVSITSGTTITLNAGTYINLQANSLTPNDLLGIDGSGNIISVTSTTAPSFTLLTISGNVTTGTATTIAPASASSGSALTIKSGEATSAAGGMLSLTGGATSNATSKGGSVQIQGGNSTTSNAGNVGGDVVIYPGTGTGGTAGVIGLNQSVGAPGTTRGASVVFFGNRTTAPSGSPTSGSVLYCDTAGGATLSSSNGGILWNLNCLGTTSTFVDGIITTFGGNNSGVTLTLGQQFARVINITSGASSPWTLTFLANAAWTGFCWCIYNGSGQTVTITATSGSSTIANGSAGLFIQINGSMVPVA